MAHISENPFSLDGLWLKGNTHTHTTLSDGKVTPNDRLKQYLDHGYDFLAITDHLKVFDSKDNPYSDLVVINALEFHPQHPSSHSGDWHFIALDVEANPEKVSTETSAQIQVNQFKKQGGYIVLCHPYWCSFSREELKMIKGIDAVEVYNSVCEKLNGKGDSSSEFDSLLLLGDRPHAIASDDCHDIDECFGGWIVVKAANKDKDSIMNAIRRGAYYSSCGPEFMNLEFKNGEVHVECSNVKKISFISRAQSGAQFKAKEDEFLTSASMQTKRFNKFVRVQIEDQYGKKAWSQAYEID
jgi:hypothetical protein